MLFMQLFQSCCDWAGFKKFTRIVLWQIALETEGRFKINLYHDIVRISCWKKAVYHFSQRSKAPPNSSVTHVLLPPPPLKEFASKWRKEIVFLWMTRSPSGTLVSGISLGKQARVVSPCHGWCMWAVPSQIGATLPGGTPCLPPNSSLSWNHSGTAMTFHKTAWPLLGYYLLVVSNSLVMAILGLTVAAVRHAVSSSFSADKLRMARHRVLWPGQNHIAPARCMLISGLTAVVTECAPSPSCFSNWFLV